MGTRSRDVRTHSIPSKLGKQTTLLRLGNFTLMEQPQISREVVIRIDHEKLRPLITKAMKATTGRVTRARGAFTILTVKPSDG